MDREIVALVERLADVVGERAALVGAYVHGSAALGGFVPGRSDVDILIVVAEAFDAIDDEIELGRRIVDAVGDGPGRGIELSVITRRQASEIAEPWPYVVHVATDDGRERIVPGSSRMGDRDLLMHVAVTLVAGLAVIGPEPAEVFGEPGRAEVLSYLAAELTESLEGESEAYAVLNACRAWQYAATGEIVSKVSGASWAKDQDGPILVVGRALSAQMGLLADRRITSDADRFVRSVIERLGSSG